MKKKIPYVGIAFLVVIGSMISFVLFSPPSYYSGVNVNVDMESDSTLDTAVNELLSQSVVNTDIIYAKSDQSIINQFLDQNGLGLTEQFGIATNVSLVDSNKNELKTTNIFGISSLPNSLSLLDKDGNPLDDGGFIQITFDSVTQQTAKSFTGWGEVKFFLDDKEIAKKYLWSNGLNSNIESMSVLDNLSFRQNDKNIALNSQISALEQSIKTLDYISEAQRQDLAFSLGINDSTKIGLTNYLESKIKSLSIQKSVVDEFPNPPSFSDREKKNFTFTFVDENLPDGLHTFRVVIYEINAVVDGKNFNWKGENIVYKLDFNVDNNKITKESESGNGEKTSIYKSDNRFVFQLSNTSVQGMYGAGTPPSPPRFYSQTTFPHIMQIYINDDLIKTIDKSSPNTEFMFPRDSQLKIVIDGVTVHEEKTPVTQINHHLSGTSSIGSLLRDGGGGSSTRPCTSYTVIGASATGIITSSFGYSDTFPYHIGATSNDISGGICW